MTADEKTTAFFKLRDALVNEAEFIFPTVEDSDIEDVFDLMMNDRQLDYQDAYIRLNITLSGLQPSNH